MRLSLFNSPKNAFCTCLPKYNLNTYLGRCFHRCLYCYAVKFPSFTGEPKPRIKLLNNIEAIVKNTKPILPVMLSDCTDPYQPLEEKYEISRKCIEVLIKHNFPILIATKSDLVLRDLELFKQAKASIAITITTMDPKISELIEPYAPCPERRIKALEILAKNHIPTIARVDPIIPTLNDDEKEFEKLVKELASIGVKQITISTLKPVKGFFSLLGKKDLELSIRLKKIYSNGKWIAGYKYLNEKIRNEILEKFRPIVLKHRLNFASCRENKPEFNTSFCDGSFYCRNTILEKYITKN
ncbi:MAG: radical SAM protein [Candidatus Bathyarchaeia archaeon]